MKKRNVATVFIYIALCLWALTTIYPFVWVILNSFKPSNEILSNSFSIPLGIHFTFANYDKAFHLDYSILNAYKNSLLISTSVVIGTLFISVLAAFAMARYNFFGKKFFYFIMIACMMFPIFAIIFPLLDVVNKMHLSNNLLGVILPQIAGNIAFTTILLTGFIQSLPIEVEESAYLDGANVFQVIWHLIVPMSKSSFATASIFVFLWSYNDLFLQRLVLTKKSMMPICALLSEITTKEFGTDYGLMTAVVTLISVPVLIVYFFLQKHIIKGLTAGAVKG